eukprot:3247215-Rhodomonas_salina.2
MYFEARWKVKLSGPVDVEGGHWQVSEEGKLMSSRILKRNGNHPIQHYPLVAWHHYACDSEALRLVPVLDGAWCLSISERSRIMIALRENTLFSDCLT